MDDREKDGKLGENYVKLASVIRALFAPSRDCNTDGS